MVAEDFPVLKPTFFPSVPRLFNRIFGRIQDNIKLATGCKKWLVNKAVSTKLSGLEKNNMVTNGCYDALVFKKMKAMMGGNVRMMLTGSAPIAKDVLDFLKICFCCPIV